MNRSSMFAGGVVGLALLVNAWGQLDARMLREPDVSKELISFVYAGDIWLVPKNGGTAQRLSSPEGEESLPRFSPDGSWLAYSANYDGNSDIYVISTKGGVPQRVTHHPAHDRLLDWYPDGRSLLMASGRESGNQRFRQLFRLSREGGLPERLPVAYGEFGSISPDGKQLAFMTRTRDYRTWKRYRGGMAPDIWLFDLSSLVSENITANPSNDAHPMWSGSLLYFLSDRGPEKRYNLWTYDLRSRAFKQVTHFDREDIHFPAIGPAEIVFEAGGRLYLLDLKSQKHREVPVQVVTDSRTLLPRPEKVGDKVASFDLSPTGKRAVFEARGEVFTVPAEHGVIRNLTSASGVAERTPSWSPDGKTIAYWSDRSGEYELMLRAADGTGNEERVTSLGPGFRYTPFWSPDSKKIAFVDQSMRIKLLNLETRQVSDVDKGNYLSHGPLQGFRVAWSPDSRWMAYTIDQTRGSRAVVLYDVEKGERRQVTSGWYDDALPEFDPDGKYLYFLTNRDFRAVYSDFDNTWVYANATQIAAVPLRRDTPSPLAARNDEESSKPSDNEKKESGQETPASEGTEAGEKPASGDSESTGEKTGQDAAKTKRIEIDLDGFEERLVILPPASGNYGILQAAPGKLVFQREARSGSGPGVKGDLFFWDLEKREEKKILGGVDGYRLSADRKKLMVAQSGAFAIVDLAPDQKTDKKLRTAEMEMTVDPKAEWNQIFNDAWRLERDYFYDPGMHGLDWQAVRSQYRLLMDDCVTRWDVNYVLGEMIAELNASHTYRGGGDTESGADRSVGLLGVDWALEQGVYRIKRILAGSPWDAEVRSPLKEPGINVAEGTYVLAVNGVPLDVRKDPFASFQGLADQTVELLVNDQPAIEGARKVLVKTLADESRLRNLKWIEQNRKRVEEASGGKIGYIYVPSTGMDGQKELARMFYSQFEKDGLIVDERFNSGGQIPDRFIELLERKPLAYWAVRDGKDWQWPPVANFGPKAMLINGWSGSGGDAFPFYFRERGLGPLIGTPTWGGLIGISGVPALVDGGGITVPTFRMYDVRGSWFAEGEGVKPDIEVIDDPTAMAKGSDPQLERAIQEVLKALEGKRWMPPARPGYEDRSR